MRIGFYFNDKGFSNIDLTDPASGNNGIGGTQYCFIMVADALTKYTSHEVIFYHYNDNILPRGVISQLVNDSITMVDCAEKDLVDLFVFKTEGVSPLLTRVRQSTLNCIAWAHNYLWDKEIEELYSNPQIKRIVFVGKEQYDRYIDHKAISKCTYIYNMFDGRRFGIRPLPEKPAVTYTGSLVKAKGFHILANSWPKIIEKVPNAQLYVIGNGQLYDRNAKLGKMGVADEKYEKIFSNALMPNGKMLQSVHFLGTMGKEKVEVYEKTTVGVMNPSGKTETFGLSAVEMEACGIPVVTRKSNGLLDTVVDGKTGYLVKGKRQLAASIVELLINQERNNEFGIQAKRFANSEFLPEKIVTQWAKLFDDVVSERAAEFVEPTGNWTNNLKWVRYINRILQKHHIATKSLLEIECTIRKMLK